MSEVPVNQNEHRHDQRIVTRVLALRKVSKEATKLHEKRILRQTLHSIVPSEPNRKLNKGLKLLESFIYGTPIQIRALHKDRRDIIESDILSISDEYEIRTDDVKRMYFNSCEVSMLLGALESTGDHQFAGRVGLLDEVFNPSLPCSLIHYPYIRYLKKGDRQNQYVIEYRINRTGTLWVNPKKFHLVVQNSRICPHVVSFNEVK